MNPSDTDRRPRTPASPLRRVAILLALGVVACVNLVPRQGWDPAFGPVVPHDTFPADCSLCHAAGDWHTLRADFAFDHEVATGVALRGAHGDASCLLCHNDRGPVQQFAAQGCGGCHADPHLGRLGRTCADCHDERTWYPRDVIVQHDRTRFPLVGAHAAAACFRCHPGAQVGNFAGASSECAHCHDADLARATDPDHRALGYSLDCERCHLPLGWEPARFDHPASFPLTNAHAGRSCRSCHTTSNLFSGLSPDCATCHTDEHAATTEPSHAAAGFATDCAQCHDTRTFRRANWPHPGSFALTFAHAGCRCSECHPGQVYSGTSSQCSSCHLQAYQATRDPNHVASGIGTDCQNCHHTATWRGAVFTHSTSFPLQGAHQRACTACHTSGTYQGLSSACASCHLAAFQASTNPPHVAFGMSQQCQDCHGITAWRPSTFQHRFPVSGPHGGIGCFECHTNPASRAAFSCIDCHEHRQSEMNDRHRGVAGYVWATANCYQCHPQGRE